MINSSLIVFLNYTQRQTDGHYEANTLFFLNFPWLASNTLDVKDLATSFKGKKKI